MRVAKHLWLMAILACGASASQAADQVAADAQPLRLCADPANLPFSTNAPEAVKSGSPGLYVEIGQALAEALGRPMETVWALSYFGKRTVRTTLLAKQCDFAVGLPLVKDFMGPQVIFSRPILTLGYALVVPKGQHVASLDDLKGKKVAVQFSSPPQSLLATRDDISSVTTMDPEEAMRRLGAGEVDAAFVWSASAGYINHSAMHDKYSVVPVDAPQMQFQAAIGFAKRDGELRDQVDAALAKIEPRIRELIAKYAVMGTDPAMKLTQAQAPVVVRKRTAQAGPAPAEAAPRAVKVGLMVVADASSSASAVGSSPTEKGDVESGKELFNGTCAHCHGPAAIVEERRINLRLLHHKYGDQMDEVFFTTVTNGRPSKGMPTWKDVFKHQDFVDILAYLKTLQQDK